MITISTNTVTQCPYDETDEEFLKKNIIETTKFYQIIVTLES